MNVEEEEDECALSVPDMMAIHQALKSLLRVCSIITTYNITVSKYSVI